MTAGAGILFVVKRCGRRHRPSWLDGEPIGGSRRSQRIRANLEAEIGGISPDQFVDRIGVSAFSRRPMRLLRIGTEQRTVVVNIAVGVAPGDELRLGSRAEFFRPRDAGEPQEIRYRFFVGAYAVGCAVSEIGGPLDFDQVQFRYFVISERRHARAPARVGLGKFDASDELRLAEWITVYRASFLWCWDGSTTDPVWNADFAFGLENTPGALTLIRNHPGGLELPPNTPRAWDICTDLLYRIDRGELSGRKGYYSDSVPAGRRPHPSLDPRNTWVQTSDLAKVAAERGEQPYILQLLFITNAESADNPEPEPPSGIRTNRHEDAERACEAFLAGLTKQCKSKNSVFDDARTHCGEHLSRKAFDRAWARKVPAAWKAPGRRKHGHEL
jgi:hypothetical protein